MTTAALALLITGGTENWAPLTLARSAFQPRVPERAGRAASG
jgi:hypothetical protein